MANIKSTAWIVDSAVYAAQQFRPNFFYLYLPQLDYAAQRTGPDSPPALKAVEELDEVLGRLIDGFKAAYQSADLVWLVASEYTIVPVDHVCYPNRLLRDAGLLKLKESEGRELLDTANSPAWALVDHQFSNVFVRDADAKTIAEVVKCFKGQPGIAEVLSGQERAKYGMDHERAGEVVLVSTPNSWQAYYWWNDDAKAPAYARTVDIHQKPGYDPVELHFDMATKSIPLNANLVKGSHGAPATSDAQRGVLLSSKAGVLENVTLADTDVCGLVLKQFRIG